MTASREACQALQEMLWRAKRRFVSVRPHYRLSIRRLLRDPAAELPPLADYLGLRPTPHALDQAARLIDPAKARHHRPGPSWTDDTTVICHTHERPHLAARLIESIFDRYPDADIVITDDSRRPLKRTDVRVLPQAIDSGLSHGRNAAVAVVTTPYVLLVDDDQVFTEATDIGLLRETIEREDLDILGGITLYPNGKPRNLYGRYRRGRKNSLLLEAVKLRSPVTRCDIVTNFFIARTEFVRRVPWDDDLKLGEHLVHFARCWKAWARVGVMPDVTVIDGPGAPGATDRNYRRDRQRASKFRQIGLQRFCRQHGFAHFENRIGGKLRIIA